MGKETKLRNMNHGFGPTPECRKNRKTWAAVTVIMLHFSAVVLYRLLKQGLGLRKILQLSDIVLWSGVLSSAIFGEIVRRLCSFAEEYHHVDNRYMGSRRKALEACLWSNHSNNFAVIMFAISSAIFAYNWLSKGDSPYSLSMYITCALVGSIGSYLLDMKPPTKVEISELNELENKHVSNGLAWSYYFGYLKLIFPEWDLMIGKAQGEKYNIDGTDIRDLMADERLYIIFPKDGYCYDDLRRLDERLEYVTTMPEQKILRGGVQERVYKNSLYRIKKGGEVKYVMMEYATPLLSMYDMSNDTRAAFSEENREEQVVAFYKKLQEILDNDPGCRDHYRLVCTGEGSANLVDIIWNTINDPSVDV